LAGFDLAAALDFLSRFGVGFGAACIFFFFLQVQGVFELTRNRQAFLDYVLKRNEFLEKTTDSLQEQFNAALTLLKEQHQERERTTRR
jgi:hypothetical protein